MRKSEREFKIGLEASFLFELDDEYSMKYFILAEKSGFDSVWIGDHFNPWHHSFKHNFYAWSIIPVAAERTSEIKIGVDVTVPIGGRYNPAIIAQAAATIDYLYPGRFMLGVGSGEAINEKMFLGYWPKWRERIERLIEAVELIKMLWEKREYFRFDGKYFKFEKIFLYLKPKTRIPIYFSALGEKAAYLAGLSKSHLMTTCNLNDFKFKILSSYKRGLRDAGKRFEEVEVVVLIGGGVGDPRDIVPRYKKLIAGALIPGMVNVDDPRVIEREAEKLSEEEIAEKISLHDGFDGLLDEICRFRDAGATQLVYADFSSKPEEVIKGFKEKIIPYFREE